MQNIKKENIKNVKEKKLIEKNNKINYYYKKEKEKPLFTKEKLDKDILFFLNNKKILICIYTVY